MVERSSSNSVLSENRIRIQGATADEIAESIKRAIEAEDLVGGDPLPTVRALAHDLGVNRNTVGSAYRQLSDAGIIKGRGRQGSRIALSKSSGTQAVSSIYNVAAGNPGYGASCRICNCPSFDQTGITVDMKKPLLTNSFWTLRANASSMTGYRSVPSGLPMARSMQSL